MWHNLENTKCKTKHDYSYCYHYLYFKRHIFFRCSFAVCSRNDFILQSSKHCMDFISIMKRIVHSSNIMDVFAVLSDIALHQLFLGRQLFFICGLSHMTSSTFLYIRTFFLYYDNSSSFLCKILFTHCAMVSLKCQKYNYAGKVSLIWFHTTLP